MQAAAYRVLQINNKATLNISCSQDSVRRDEISLNAELKSLRASRDPTVMRYPGIASRILFVFVSEVKPYKLS